MRHLGVTDIDAQARRTEITDALRAGVPVAAIAADQGVTARYVYMLATAAGLAKPRGRPRKETRHRPTAPARPHVAPRRGGYSLLETER